MKYKTLQDVPDAKLRKWLVTAEQTFGPQSPTARIYRRELGRRKDRQTAKGVRHGK